MKDYIKIDKHLLLAIGDLLRIYALSNAMVLFRRPTCQIHCWNVRTGVFLWDFLPRRLPYNFELMDKFFFGFKSLIHEGCGECKRKGEEGRHQELIVSSVEDLSVVEIVVHCDSESEHRPI